MQHSTDHKQDKEQNGEDASPRSAAAYIGSLLFSTSLFLLFGSCCLWSLSGSIFTRLPTVTRDWWAHLSEGEAAETYTGVAIMLTLVAAFGLFGAGLGLQGEKKSSGYWAMASAMLMLMGWVVAMVVSLVFGGAGIGGLLLTGMMSLISLCLFVLAFVAASILSAYPPPKEYNTITDEELREMAIEKLKRKLEQHEV